MRVTVNFILTLKRGIQVMSPSACSNHLKANANWVAKKIQSSRRDGKRNRRDFLIFVFL